MTRSSARLAFVILTLVAGACGQGAAPSPAATDAASAPAAPTSTPDASAAGSPTTAALPPDASLAAEGGEPVVGQLGSYTWGDGGSDSPWLPGAPITVGAGEPLSVTLGGDAAITAWTAVRAPVGSTSGAGATVAGSGSGVIGFAVAEPGRWTVAVTVGFPGGSTATWYWQVDVT